MTEWEAFIAWVEAPEAYNWLTLLGVAVGGMTAIFTGYTAGTQWIDRRKKVTAEWFHTIEGDRIKVSCKIFNGTKGTVTGDRAVVDNKHSWIGLASRRPKGENWPKNEASVSIEIAAGASEKLVFDVLPDPKRLRTQAKRYSSRFGFWLSKFLWQKLQWQLPFGARVSIQLRLRRRSSPMRPIRITHRIRIYEPSAIQLAEKAEANAAAK